MKFLHAIKNVFVKILSFFVTMIKKFFILIISLMLKLTYIIILIVIFAIIILTPLSATAFIIFLECSLKIKFFLVLLVWLVFFIFLCFMGKKGEEEKKQINYDNEFKGYEEIDEEINYAEDQLYEVETSRFYKRRLLNEEEFSLFKKIEPIIKNINENYRLFSQVSLGEIIGSTTYSAYIAINTKRIDFVVFDMNQNTPKKKRIILAIEYQGTGHQQGNAHIRDKIKKTAIAKAKIDFLEIFSNDDEIAITNKIRKKLKIKAMSLSD